MYNCSAIGKFLYPQWYNAIKVSVSKNVDYNNFLNPSRKWVFAVINLDSLNLKLIHSSLTSYKILTNFCSI